MQNHQLHLVYCVLKLIYYLKIQNYTFSAIYPGELSDLILNNKTSEDLIPSQRELSFLIFEKKSIWVLIIFFNISTTPPPKMAKTLEGLSMELKSNVQIFLPHFKTCSFRYLPIFFKKYDIFIFYLQIFKK